MQLSAGVAVGSGGKVASNGASRYRFAQGRGVKHAFKPDSPTACDARNRRAEGRLRESSTEWT